MRYFDSYLASTNATTLLNQGNGGRVPSQDYHDVFAGYRFPANRFAGSEVRLGVKNIFNARAPFDAGSSAFYSGIGDVRGASYYLTVGTSF